MIGCCEVVKPPSVMQVIPFAFVAVWWVVALIVLLLYFKFGTDKKIPFEDKYVYELLPVVYDQCNGLTAKHVYLIRIAYGHRNKRFFFPNATISLRFYDDQNKNVATVQLKPKLLTENHRRYLRQTPRSSTDTFLYGKSVCCEWQVKSDCNSILLHHRAQFCISARLL